MRLFKKKPKYKIAVYINGQLVVAGINSMEFSFDIKKGYVIKIPQDDLLKELLK